MTDTSETERIVFERGPITATRLDAVACAGAILAMASVALPWGPGSAGPITGGAFELVSPIVAAAALAGLLVLARPYERVRYAVVSVIGVTLAAWGTILVLGIPAGAVGVGVLVLLTGGLLVTGGAWTALGRRTSTLVAAGIVCAGSLVVNTTMLVALLG